MYIDSSGSLLERQINNRQELIWFKYILVYIDLGKFETYYETLKFLKTS